MKTRMNKTKLMLLAVTAATLTLTSCGSKENQEKSSKQTITAEVATTKVTDFPVQYSFSGKLQADKQSNLSTRVMGQVQKVYVKPGQKVNAGELLIV